MATLVDYQTLSPARMVLNSTTTNQATLTWQMPRNFVFGTGVAKPIIAFMVAPSEGVSRVHIRINHRPILSPVFSGFRYTAFYHPFSARSAFPDSTSFSTEAPVLLSVDRGSMTIENVVMWYQVNS